MALEVPPSQRPSDVPDPGGGVSGFVGQIQQLWGQFSGMMTQPMGRGAGGGAPDVESVVPKWIRRLEEAGAVAGVVAAVYEAYIHFRGTGAGHKQAKRMAMLANGIRVRRRRMRPTNLHALRRAVRRLRGFRRAAGKVHGVLGGRRGGGYYAPRRRRRRMYRRGDVSPFLVEDVEDYQDDIDDLEDEGLDPSSFPEEIYE